MKADVIDAIDDVSADYPDADGQESNDDPNRDIPKDDRWAGFPDEVQDRGDVLERM